jgi:hypothetical protein
MTETKPKRRWFRFSIRDLLWLTLVVGMALAWIANIHSMEQKHEDESRAATSKIVELRGELSRTSAEKVYLARMLRAKRPANDPDLTLP